MTGRENTRRQLLQEIRWAEGMVLRDTEGWEGEDWGIANGGGIQGSILCNWMGPGAPTEVGKPEAGTSGEEEFRSGSAELEMPGEQPPAITSSPYPLSSAQLEEGWDPLACGEQGE